MEWMQIGEVARRTGLTTRTLRHYDALGLLVPSGRSGGDYRQYTLEDVRRLLAIQHLKSLGLGPVSYTHLRAPETVLDIECRLLIEKTKKKNTQPTYTTLILLPSQ